MPRYIIKIHDDRDNKDYYLEWSTIVDAPVSFGMSLEEFTEFYIKRYGTASKEELKDRMERVEQTNVSSLIDTFDSLIALNRAGEKEACIDKDGILERYCRNHSA